MTAALIGIACCAWMAWWSSRAFTGIKRTSAVGLNLAAVLLNSAVLFSQMGGAS